VLAGGVGWWFGSGPGSLVAVPSVAGLPYQQAADALAADGFVPQQQDEFSIDVEPGTVIETDPGAGQRLDKGATVTVVVSAGPASHTLEPLNGRSEQEAREYLDGVNVTVAETPVLLFSDADEGVVINAYVTPRSGGDVYECGEGCDVFEADSAELYVSAGAFPDVSGMSIDQATTTLTDKGLTVAAESQFVFSSDVAKDEVLGVADRAEAGNWRPGDQVQLIVSKGPELFPVPDVTGKTLTEAKQILDDNGFTSSYAAWGDLPGFAEMARVTGQNPGSDKSLPRGGNVNLSIQLSG
jgi:serine/threonine-protein kinase